MDEIRSMSDVESPDEREIGPSWKVWYVYKNLFNFF